MPTKPKITKLKLPGKVVRGRFPIEVSEQAQLDFEEGLKEIEDAERTAVIDGIGLRLA